MLNKEYGKVISRVEFPYSGSRKDVVLQACRYSIILFNILNLISLFRLLSGV